MTSLPAVATDFPENRNLRATELIAAVCGYLLRLALGVAIIAAPLAFVTLHRSPLPEEALAVAVATWPGAVQQATADQLVR